MSKEDKIDTSTAVGNVFGTWIKYILFLLVTARFGAGNLSRLVNWKNSMKQPDNLSKPPYSPPGKDNWAPAPKPQAGGNPFLAMKAAQYAMKNPNLAKMAAKTALKNPNLAAAALGVNSRKKFGSGSFGPAAGSAKHDLPYSLIGGDVMSDWIGRSVAFSFATQRKMFNKFFEFIGPKIYGNNWKGGKTEDHLYVVNMLNIFFLSWIFFWLLFLGQALFGNLITIWGASIFGGYLSKAWGDWDPFDFDFSMAGGTMKLIFHTCFCLIPWLIFFCLELPIISVAQIIMLLIFFWSYTFNKEAEFHWKLLWKYPRVIFYLIMVLFIMSSSLELSGDHLKDPRSAQGIMYPFIFVPMFIMLIIEYIFRYERGKK